MRTRYRIYGIESYEKVIDDILERHQLESSRFAVELILTEAMSNAYKHGNMEDATKPIDVQAVTEAVDGYRTLRIMVTDDGDGIGMPDMSYDPEENIYGESGRGMFLIRQFADNVEVNCNQINIYKCLQEEHV